MGEISPTPHTTLLVRPRLSCIPNNKRGGKRDRRVGEDKATVDMMPMGDWAAVTGEWSER